MSKRSSNESALGDVLKEIIAANKLQSGIDQVEVAQAWRTVLGNGVNSYTRKVALKGNTVYVELTSSVLREELQYGKDKIIRILNEALGREVVKDVVLR